jgi:predicted Rossmann fold nucleotide-binding protein DprA/Smf involved in DNA uptake
MAALSEASLATVLLTQRIVAVGAASLKASEYWALRGLVPDVGVLLGQDAPPVEALGADSAVAARIATLCAAATAVAFKLEELEHAGVRAVAATDDRYPARLVEQLGGGAPAVLYVAGNLDLLKHQPVAVASADDDDGSATLHAALTAGGDAIGVLADSLVLACRSSVWRRHLLAGHLTLLTPYAPTARATAAGVAGCHPLISPLQFGAE